MAVGIVAEVVGIVAGVVGIVAEEVGIAVEVVDTAVVVDTEVLAHTAAQVCIAVAALDNQENCIVAEVCTMVLEQREAELVVLVEYHRHSLGSLLCRLCRKLFSFDRWDLHRNMYQRDFQPRRFLP